MIGDGKSQVSVEVCIYEDNVAVVRTQRRHIAVTNNPNLQSDW